MHRVGAHLHPAHAVAQARHPCQVVLETVRGRLQHLSVDAFAVLGRRLLRVRVDLLVLHRHEPIHHFEQILRRWPHANTRAEVVAHAQSAHFSCEKAVELFRRVRGVRRARVVVPPKRLLDLGRVIQQHKEMHQVTRFSVGCEDVCDLGHQLQPRQLTRNTKCNLEHVGLNRRHHVR